MLQNLAITNDDCGGGQMVSVLAIYSTILARIPLESTVFILQNCLKRPQKRPGMAHLESKYFCHCQVGTAKKVVL